MALFKVILLNPEQLDRAKMQFSRVIFYSFISLFILFCSFAHADMTQLGRSNNISFYINSKFFDTLEPQKADKLRQKVKKGLFFLSNRVPKHLPLVVRHKMAQQEMVFTIMPDMPVDGYFWGVNSGIDIQEYNDFPELNNKSLHTWISINVFDYLDQERILVHEYYHVLHSLMRKTEEEGWIREGLAQLFEYIVLGTMNGRNAQYAFFYPQVPLITDYKHNDYLYSNDPLTASFKEDVKFSKAIYGQDLLYFYYLYTHCGGNDLFWRLTYSNDSLSGKLNIDLGLMASLRSDMECSNFDNSVGAFQVAKLKNSYQALPDGNKNKTYQLMFNKYEVGLPRITNLSDFNDSFSKLPYYAPIVASPQLYSQIRPICLNCLYFWADLEEPFLIQQVAPTDQSVSRELIIIKR